MLRTAIGCWIWVLDCGLAYSLQLTAYSLFPSGVIWENAMNFEKLEVWKMSTQLSIDVYKGMKELRDFGFKDQITRSSLSVPSNIAEGMSRNGDREKLQFLNIARGSCSELRTQIYIGMEIDYINNELGKTWIEQTKHIASMLSGLMKKIKG